LPTPLDGHGIHVRCCWLLLAVLLQLPSMTHEGAAWFQNLTLADPYYILGSYLLERPWPCLNSTSMSESLEQMGTTADTMKRVMGAVGLLMIPVSGFVPSAVALLWTSNAVIQIWQTWHS